MIKAEQELIDQTEKEKGFLLRRKGFQKRKKEVSIARPRSFEMLKEPHMSTKWVFETWTKYAK